MSNLTIQEKVKKAKEMAREELGLPDSVIRFNMHITENGIKLSTRDNPDVEVYYSWEEIEIELEAINEIS